MSENAYQPFLKIIDPDDIDRTDLGRRLRIGRSYMYCRKDGFYLTDENGKEVGSLIISQSDGIDTEERIEKYKSIPLIRT